MAHRLALVLHGPARLEFRDRELPLQRKGLAILYYLALQGPTRRERLADLLWDGERAAGNLRVELHRMRSVLRDAGLRAFTDGQDPLRLPDFIELDEHATGAGAHQAMEGLDDLSAAFQAWLEAQRAQLERGEGDLPLRADLARRTARAVRLPFLLILHGPPGSGRRSFARALAQELALPFVESRAAGGRALHYLRSGALAEADPREVVATILNDDEGLWVVSEPIFGEDSGVVLRLRRSFPVERTRYLELGPLPWRDARDHLLADLPWNDAASLYTAAAGHLGFLAELRAMQRGSGAGGMRLPQRIRASYELELRRLDPAARSALENLSVHPGALPPALLAAFGAESQLDALESTRWLRFERRYAFRDEAARSVLYSTLPAGRRHRLHLRAAEALEAHEPPLMAAYHRRAAGAISVPTVPDERLPGWASAVRSGPPRGAARSDRRRVRPQPVAIGRELALLDGAGAWRGVEAAGDAYAMVREPQQLEASSAEFTLPDEACVLRIRARAHVDNPFGIGLTGEAVPLRLRFLGKDPATVAFADVDRPQQLDDGTLLLPLGEELCADLVTHHDRVCVESGAHAGVLEFDLQAFALTEGPAPGTDAYRLDRPVRAPVEPGVSAPG